MPAVPILQKRKMPFSTMIGSPYPDTSERSIPSVRIVARHAVVCSACRSGNAANQTVHETLNSIICTVPTLSETQH